MELKDFYISRRDNDDVLVKAVAYIRKDETGEVRECDIELYWSDNAPFESMPSTFIWEEGNYGCDCNRHIFFQRAKNDDDDDIQCGEGKYAVNIKNPKTGKIFYREFGGELDEGYN